MRFILRRKILSLSDRFTIKDESGRSWFTVTSRFFPLVGKLRIDDMQGQEVIRIEQKLLSFLPQFTIYQAGEPVARVKKALTFLKPKFHVEGSAGSFEIQGNPFGMEHTISKDGAVIARLSKSWVSLTDSYGVEIDDAQDPAFILALAIVIDQVHRQSGPS